MSVIMKFGGTSVADAEAIGRVVAIVERELAARSADPPVVVVSAMSTRERSRKSRSIQNAGDARSRKSPVAA